MPTLLPTDEEMLAMRRRGLLECQCRHPIPVLLALWNAYECDRCGKRCDHRVTR